MSEAGPVCGEIPSRPLETKVGDSGGSLDEWGRDAEEVERSPVAVNMAGQRKTRYLEVTTTTRPVTRRHGRHMHQNVDLSDMGYLEQ